MALIEEGWKQRATPGVAVATKCGSPGPLTRNALIDKLRCGVKHPWEVSWQSFTAPRETLTHIVVLFLNRNQEAGSWSSVSC
jgi:hypothetical protein